MSVDISVLTEELLAAGLPVAGCALLALGSNTSGYTNATFYTRAEGIVKVDWIPANFPPTSPQNTSAASIVAAHAGVKVKRTLFDIRTDLVALTTNQKNNAWTDLISGNPPKWSQDAGANAASLATIQMLGASSTLGAADILEAKIRAMAFYVQDNPKYLVNPSFDNTINVPGDQPA